MKAKEMSEKSLDNNQILHNTWSDSGQSLVRNLNLMYVPKILSFLPNQLGAHSLKKIQFMFKKDSILSLYEKITRQQHFLRIWLHLFYHCLSEFFCKCYLSLSHLTWWSLPSQFCISTKAEPIAGWQHFLLS